MKPIPFDEQTLVLNKNHENGFLPLPVFRDKMQWISCWELTDEEFEILRKTRRLWISMHTGASAPFPILPMIKTPFAQSKYIFHVLYYRSEDHKKSLIIWMGCDANPPEQVLYQGDIYIFSPDVRTPYREDNYPLEPGTFFFRFPSVDEAKNRKDFMLKEFQKVSQDLPEEAKKEFLSKLDQASLTHPVLIEKHPAGRETLWI